MKPTTLTLAILLLALWLPPTLAQSAGADFFVAPSGSDENPGTQEKPFATIARARDAVRQRITAGLEADVKVLLREGTYRLDEPLVFGPEDSGTEKHAITYAAHSGEKVVVSGGRPVTGWAKGQGEVWTAPVPGVKEGEWYFRHLFVAGRRALRARTPNKDDENPCRQLTGAELAGDLSRYTLSVPGGLLGDWSNPSDIEVMVAGNWAINRLPVQSIDREQNVVVLAPPHAQGHEAIRPGPGRWFCFENAPEMLDQPGEWYLDRQTGLLSYWPISGEDMANIEVIAPVVSRLVEVKGTPEKPVRNLHFRGIRFKHTDLALPDGGYLGIQACHCTTGSDWSRPWARVPAAIRWDYVEHSSIEDGAMAHLGGCGVELVAGCHDNLVQGNHVFDVSGNGIMLGGPKSEADVPKRNRIANNHVHACGVEYYGAIGIWVGFAQQAVVAHNLVHDLPYSGISVGWQWNPDPTPCKENVIESNHVYDVMNRLCDGGCIYTLGFQPGTVFRGNHLHDAHRSRYAQGAPNNGMFIDQGSKGYLFEQNVIYNTAAELVRFNQCSRDWHTWRDNHIGEPAEVKESGKAIIAEAGLEPPYRERLTGASD
ncbi:MAG: right-handed parallel beta-helix repeat-containing protein [Planctomycetota bacterium]